jgi:PPM family protein phosphatase
MCALELTALTHQGRVRERNEDSITVAGWVSDATTSGLRRSWHDLADLILCAVADGMGGHASGEVASRYAIKRLAAEPFAGADVNAVAAVLAAVNAELYQAMAANRSLRGMGTTIAGLLLSAGRVLWFNVGDSRIYRHRERLLRQLSLDHVPPGPRSGAITQALGGSLTFMPIDPHIGVDDLAVPSRWLICSDGLTDMVTVPEIARCMEENDEQAAHSLFEAALAAGGEDNISIILASVGG